MSVMDDFNRFAFDRAQSKYNRAQYDQMTTDDWVALVEGYKADAERGEQDADLAADLQRQVDALEAKLDALQYPND